jgi:hypothetical protein
LQRFTPTLPPVCTRVCTGKPENDNTDTHYGTLAGTSPQGSNSADAGHRDESERTEQGGRLDKLAAALLTLSPADRERLAVLLQTELE